MGGVEEERWHGMEKRGEEGKRREEMSWVAKITLQRKKKHPTRPWLREQRI